MDIFDQVVVDVYGQYHNVQLSSDVVLGFELDHRVTNFSILRDDYMYTTNNLDTRYVPGLMIKETSTMLVRSIVPISNNRFSLMMPFGVDIVPVHITCVYNGTDLVILTICGYSDYIFSISYIDIIVTLYKILTSTGLGILSHKYESETRLSSILPVSYVPITSTYTNALNNIARSSASDSIVCINHKYDGQAMWLYMSRTVPASLLYQMKTKSGIAHRYIGRVADLPDTSLMESYCLLLERLEGTKGYEYVVTDAFSDIDEQYIDRMKRISDVLNKYNQPGPYSLRIQYSITMSNAVNLKAIEQTSRTIITRLMPDELARGCSSIYRTSITTMMSTVVPQTDGYIMYIGNNRPLKVKLVDMITLDVEFVKSKSMWNCEEELSIRFETPDCDTLMSTTDDVIVMEVNIHTGRIVRVRGDRVRGNSKPVRDNIVRSYNNDLKYSNKLIWSGIDIRFSLLINRTFKRYMHMRYMLRGSNLLDVGSGNGGDISIWRDMEYKVLALEKDETRFRVLSEKLSDDVSARVIKDDMRNLMYHLSNSAIRYHNVSFMRSLSMLDSNEICVMLRHLKAYGCTKILIVTMVDNGSINHEYATNNQMFKIAYGDNRTVTVSYTVDGIATSYTDNCYSEREWEDMCLSSGYKVTIKTQSSFVSETYSLSYSTNIHPCFTDIGLILS
jgi:hypothetical protein